MNAVLKRILRKVRITVPGLAPHLDEIDFHSGLGDSAYLLYGLARALKPRVAVEIGSARGKSACYVGRALKENGSGKLFAIDPHTRTNWNDENSIDTLDEMRRNIRAFGIQNQVASDAGVKKISGHEQSITGWALSPPFSQVFYRTTSLHCNRLYLSQNCVRPVSSS